MARIILEPPMPRMLGISPEFKQWSQEVTLEEPVSLRVFLTLLADRISPRFVETINRPPKTYFEQIRIAIDISFVGSNDYDRIVSIDSDVIIFSPYVDG